MHVWAFEHLKTYGRDSPWICSKLNGQWTNHKSNFGQPVYNSSGHLVAAKIHKSIWMTKVKFDEVASKAAFELSFEKNLGKAANQYETQLLTALPDLNKRLKKVWWWLVDFHHIYYGTVVLRAYPTTTKGSRAGTLKAGWAAKQ